MASEFSKFSQSSFSIDDFEGLEVTQFDQNTLRELLYEPEEEIEGNRVPMPEPNPVDGYWCPDNINEDFTNLNWLEMVEETYALYGNDDIGAWYGSTFMDGNFDSYSAATTSDEIGYIGLWQEN